MLVSAAIEPYRKSYGKAWSSDATAGGSEGSDRSTASPSMMCVPGVHAHASAGSSATSSSAAAVSCTARTRADRAGDRCPRPVTARSDAELPPLALDRLAEILQLGFDRLGDALARFLHELAERLADLFGRHLVPELLALVGHPFRTALPVLGAAPRALEPHHAGPLGALAGRLHDRHERAVAARARPEQQRRAGSDRETDERRRQQVVLLLALVVTRDRAGGFAGLAAGPRPWSYCRSHLLPRYRASRR